MSFNIRSLQENDIPLIFSSYMKSLRPHRINCPNTLYYQAEHKRFEWCMLTGLTYVMTPKDDNNLIIGWANAILLPSSVIINYVYVKHAFRSSGIARDLVKCLVDTTPESSHEYSIYVPSGNRLIQEFKLTYNPYIWDHVHERSDVK